jgi:DNA-directed RNA polymerase subunit RPC12/RpoP
MSIKGRGSAAYGHIGWVQVYCRICNRKLKMGTDIVYKCPKCEKKYRAYFCEADARGLKYRCPYCGSELVQTV